MFDKFFRLKAIIGTLPVSLQNGQTADASQVMSDLNFIINQVNANAADVSLVALLAANNIFAGNQTIGGTLGLVGALNIGGAAAATNFVGLNRTVGGSIQNPAIAAYNLANDGTDLHIARYTAAGAYNGEITIGAGGNITFVNPASAATFSVAGATGNAAVGGTLAIGGTLNVVSPTAPNRTITMVVGGVTVYVAAKTTND